MSATYTINDLERLTGIKAHTIRIWERRYGLFSPQRTKTNIRTYRDDDLRKVLNVNTLIKNGWKISKISVLNAQELEARVWDSMKHARTAAEEHDIYIQALIAATMSFDEEWFDTVFTDVTTRYGMSLAMQHVIAPFLERIGVMWTVVRLHPGQEHFASNLIRRKMLSAIDRLPRIGSKGRFLLFLPPWEEHEIGLIYASYLLKSAGYEVIYLGQRVPLQALTETIAAVEPKAMLTFFSAEISEKEIRELLDTILARKTGVPLYLAARKEILERVSLSDKVKLLDSPQALMNIL